MSLNDYLVLGSLGGPEFVDFGLYHGGLRLYPSPGYSGDKLEKQPNTVGVEIRLCYLGASRVPTIALAWTFRGPRHNLGVPLLKLDYYLQTLIPFLHFLYIIATNQRDSLIL